MFIQMFLSYPVLSQSKHNYMYPLYYRLKLVNLIIYTLESTWNRRMMRWEGSCTCRLKNVIELLLTQAKLAAAVIAFK
ncbi:hypothetical protein ALC62_15268 [Cyphomyrmex costatus]|uniref:Uncharacterized protein n=1 Tax=Cyphomyrmex costatus TaxID=456900 RepID=A0A151I7E4_9HYME|nr:hypothetical protein ALC62_15268 [Cyphomyrmex costatus]